MANSVDPDVMAYLDLPVCKLNYFRFGAVTVTMNRIHSIDAIFGIIKRHTIHAVSLPQKLI